MITAGGKGNLLKASRSVESKSVDLRLASLPSFTPRLFNLFTQHPICIYYCVCVCVCV